MGACGAPGGGKVGCVHLPVLQLPGGHTRPSLLHGASTDLLSSAWCSTSTHENGTHILGSESLCPSTCPGATTTTTTSTTTTVSTTTTATTTTTTTSSTSTTTATS